MSATLFTAGTVWTGAGSESDALLVVDGTVRALGGRAREAAAGIDCEQVDLEGGFLMPSFGDGHSHPLYGGLEAVGPAVRSCGSVEEILAAVLGARPARVLLPLHARVRDRAAELGVGLERGARVVPPPIHEPQRATPDGVAFGRPAPQPPRCGRAQLGTTIGAGSRNCSHTAMHWSMCCWHT